MLNGGSCCCQVYWQSEPEYQRKAMGSTAYLSGAPFFNPRFQQESYCWNFSFLCSILYPISFPQIFQSHISITSHEFRIRGALSMADCHVIIRKAWPWTIVGKSLESATIPACKNTSIADFNKEQAHCSRYKKYNCLSLPKSPCFQWESTTLNREPISSLISTQILYNIELVLVLNIAQIPLEGR